jgi:hypothetical protein
LQNLVHLPKFCNWIGQHDPPTLGQDWPCRPEDPNRHLPANQEHDTAILAMGNEITQCVACLVKAFVNEYWSNDLSDIDFNNPTVRPIQAMAERWFCQIPNLPLSGLDRQEGESDAAFFARRVQQPGESDAAFITRKLALETVAQRNARVTRARGQQDSDEFLLKLLGAIRESIAPT